MLQLYWVKESCRQVKTSSDETDLTDFNPEDIQTQYKAYDFLLAMTILYCIYTMKLKKNSAWSTAFHLETCKVALCSYAQWAQSVPCRVTCTCAVRLTSQICSTVGEVAIFSLDTWYPKVPFLSEAFGTMIGQDLITTGLPLKQSQILLTQYMCKYIVFTQFNQNEPHSRN